VTEWIDLNAPAARSTRELRRTLCESRIARARKALVGAIAQSKLLARVDGAFTPAIEKRLGWALTFASGVAAGMGIVILAVTK
jgi:hypothetical protein